MAISCSSSASIAAFLLRNSNSAGAKRLSTLMVPIPPTNSIRHASTSRRMTKKLRIAPDPSFLPSPQTPPATHIIYNPPPSIPNVYHTPNIFLPQGDIRKPPTVSPEVDQTQPQLQQQPQAQSQSQSQSQAELQTVALPPPVHKTYEKKYHLTPKEFEEMRRLRNENPGHWTRSKLAKKFGCSQFFAGMVAEAGEQRLEEAREEEKRVKRGWGVRRRVAREDRKRRREAWGRG